MGTRPPSPKRGRIRTMSVVAKRLDGSKWHLSWRSASPQATVLDGDPAPCPKRGSSPSPIFGKFLLCPNGWMHHDATWYGCRPQPRGLCVRWGPISLPKKGAEPPRQFSAHVYCGQTAGWIKMALGMEVGLDPGHIMLDGKPAPFPRKGDRAPNIRRILLSLNGWMNQDGTWHGGGPWS